MLRDAEGRACGAASGEETAQTWATANGKDVALGTFSATRKRWSPPKQVLEPGESATLRDQLVQELVGLRSQQEATDWAQRALGAKNTLRGADAAVVEAAFASRLAELASDDSAEAPLPSSSAAGPGDAKLAEPAETPGLVALLAALRASVELSTAKQTKLPLRWVSANGGLVGGCHPRRQNRLWLRLGLSRLPQPHREKRG
jgi:hypothetical protein